MRHLTILVDMDDTIEDLLQAWLAALNRICHTAVSPDDITDWDMRQFFPALSDEQLYAPLGDPAFWETVLPKPGAPEYLKRLIDDGHRAFIVTSSHYAALASKMERVLFRYFPYLAWDNVIVTSHKELVVGDVLVDDGVHNHTVSSRAGLLMDAPHNRNYRAGGRGLIRVRSWSEVYFTICQLAAQPRKGV